MADVTNLRFAQMLKRTLGLKAIDPGRTISPALAGTYDLQDSYRPERRADRGERLFVAAIQTSQAVANFNVMQLIAISKLVVIKRIVLSFLMPTSTTQPGQLYFQIGNQAAATTPGTQGVETKDLRTPSGNLSTTASVVTQAVGGPSIQVTISQYFAQFFPGAATVPTFLDADNLDVILPPGNSLNIGLRGDTLPTATWNYTLQVHGYEYSPDPAELQTTPP